MKAKVMIAMMTIGLFAGSVSAQTYYYDSNKDNIMRCEISAGVPPTGTYQLFHPTWYKTALTCSKSVYRALVYNYMYPQAEYADSIKADMVARAEIEALNVADRELDIAWATEGSKVNTMMDTFYSNINQVVFSGGTVSERTEWQELYHAYEMAIEEMQDAYMPNSQRKKSYLLIYDCVKEANEQLVAFNLANYSKYLLEQEVAAAQNNTVERKKDFSTIVSDCRTRWQQAVYTSVGEGISPASSVATEDKVIR